MLFILSVWGEASLEVCRSTWIFRETSLKPIKFQRLEWLKRGFSDTPIEVTVLEKDWLPSADDFMVLFLVDRHCIGAWFCQSFCNPPCYRYKTFVYDNHNHEKDYSWEKNWRQMVRNFIKAPSTDVIAHVQKTTPQKRGISTEKFRQIENNLVDEERKK